MVCWCRMLNKLNQQGRFSVAWAGASAPAFLFVKTLAGYRAVISKERESFIQDNCHNGNFGNIDAVGTTIATAAEKDVRTENKVFALKTYPDIL